MTQRNVTTQAEFDQAITDKVDWIDIRSPAGVWLEIWKTGSATVTAYGSVTVTAYGSATVTAYDSATVTAYGSATVTAYGSATVTAYGSATVRAYGSATVTAYGSATVTAYDSATVTAYDSATVTAYDSATVRAYGSATVRAYGSATVRAYGSATVTAYDSATVRAYGSATVRATKLCAVHLHSANVKVDGGVILDHTKVDDFTAAEWCEYHGVEVVDGVATLYKAVDDAWTTDRGTDYSPGSLPSCDDFTDTNECGGGLHFGPTPTHALAYHYEATKFVAVGVLVSELRPITGSTAKAKAPRVVRPCVEVDEHGRAIEAAKEQAA